MSSIPTRRNITIHFSDDELDLLTAFNQYCKTSYETKSGWIKRRIYSELLTTHLDLHTVRYLRITHHMVQLMMQQLVRWFLASLTMV